MEYGIFLLVVPLVYAYHFQTFLSSPSGLSHLRKNNDSSGEYDKFFDSVEYALVTNNYFMNPLLPDKDDSKQLRLLQRSNYTFCFGNVTFFLESASKNCRLLSYFTPVVISVGGIEEVPELLDKISIFLRGEAHKNFNGSHCSNFPFFIMIQSLKMANDVTSKEHKWKDEIKRLILDKMDPRSLNSFHLDTSIYLVIVPEDSDVVNIMTKVYVWEVYSIHNQSFLNSVNETIRSLLTGDFNKMLRRKDWNGVEIIGLPFALLDNMNDTGEVQGVGKFEANVGRDSQSQDKFRLLSGLGANIFWDFGTALNFTPSILRPSTYDMDFVTAAKHYGQSFDIIISFFATIPRSPRILDHLLPTYLEGIVAYFVQPPIYSIRNIYILPFSPTMWGLIVFTWLAIAFSLSFVSRVRAILCDQVSLSADQPDHDDDELVIKDALLWAVAAASQQGWYITPSSIPCRIIFFNGLVFSFLCFAAYTATIVSMLGKPPVPIENLQTLLKNSRDIYIVKGSDLRPSLVDGIRKRNPELLSKIHLTDLRTAFDHVLYNQRGSSCVLDWPAYLIETIFEVFGTKRKSTLNFKNPEALICSQIRNFNYHYFPVKASMFVPNRSPLKKHLNYVTIVGFERGLFHRYWSEFKWNTKVRCLERSNKVYALGLFDTSFAFLILLGGHVTSGAVLGLEMLHKRRSAVMIKSNGNN